MKAKSLSVKRRYTFVPTISDLYEQRLLLINAGRWVTKREDLFEPLKGVDVKKYSFLGVLRDSIAKELYSFSHELKLKSLEFHRARKPSYAKEYEKNRLLYVGQSLAAEELFWKRLCLALTLPENEKSRHILCKGWKVHREIEAVNFPAIKPDLVYLYMPGQRNGHFSNV